MVRTCPSCGRQAIDDQSQFCNKCGAPLPQDQPKKILVRTTPRLAETPPADLQPPVRSPVAESPAPVSRAPAAPPSRIPADPLQVRAPVKRPVQKNLPRRTPLPFRKFIAKDYLRGIYWLGVIAILLIVFSGITTSPTTSATTSDSSTDTATKASDDLLAGIPLFWIGIFLFVNLLWRAVCEMAAVQFALYDSATSPLMVLNTAHDSLFEDEMAGSEGAGADEYVECPRCGKVVAASELRTCAHCGVQGCSSCIRMMGLVKKTLTCRDCYERK